MLNTEGSPSVVEYPACRGISASASRGADPPWSDFQQWPAISVVSCPATPDWNPLARQAAQNRKENKKRKQRQNIASSAGPAEQSRIRTRIRTRAFPKPHPRSTRHMLVVLRNCRQDALIGGRMEDGLAISQQSAGAKGARSSPVY